MPQNVVEFFENKIAEDEREVEKANASTIHELREKLSLISRELDRLTDVYIAQDIERQEYLIRRASLLSERKSVEEVLATLERGGMPWLEPMREWIKDASILNEIAEDTSLPAKKSSLQKIFGSNLYLKNEKVFGTAQPQYAALAASRENFSDSNSLLRR